MFNEERKIPTGTAAILLTAAITFDVLEFVLSFFAIGEVATPLISPALDFGFWISFQFYGVSYTKSGGTFIFTILTWIAEEIPVIDGILPGQTMVVGRLLWQNYKLFKAQEATAAAAQTQSAAENFNARKVAATNSYNAQISSVYEESSLRQSPSYSPSSGNARTSANRTNLRSFPKAREKPNTLNLKKQEDEVPA